MRRVPKRKDAKLRVLRVAIAGTPNSGKTTLFNVLTGTHQETGNWPGVTVEKKEGVFTVQDVRVELVDLPGVYGLSAYTTDERIARDYLLHEHPDAVIVVVDAANLTQGRLLVLQILQLRVPTVVALNMMDQAEREGLEIDTEELERVLGVPVVPLVAVKGRGVAKLKERLLEAARQVPPEPRIPVDPRFEEAQRQLEEAISATTPAQQYPKAWLAQRLLVEDPWALTLFQKDPAYPRIRELLDRWLPELRQRLGPDLEVYLVEQAYALLHGLVQRIVHRKTTLRKRIAFTQRVDRFLLNPWFGLPLFALVMALTFEATFQLSTPFVDAIAAFFDLLGSGLRQGLASTGVPSWIVSLLVDGVLSGVASVLTFVPPIFLLFGFIAFFENTGYMARVAFVMDRFMHALGISGKSFIPMVLGFGCNVPAIMATRTLESEKDRLITILVIPLMSCSARLPVYVLFASVFFPGREPVVVLSLYFLGIALALTLIKVLQRVLFHRREPESFVMELPPFRMPYLRNILLYMWMRGKVFVKNAGSIILVASVIIWILASLPPGVEYAGPHSVLGWIGRILAPLLKPAGFGFAEAAIALITGVMAKELVVGTLGTLLAGGSIEGLQHALHQYFTPLSAYAFLVMTLIYVPCMATVAVIKQETGSWKWAAVEVAMTISLGYTLAVLVYQVGRLLV